MTQIWEELELGFFISYERWGESRETRPVVSFSLRFRLYTSLDHMFCSVILHNLHPISTSAQIYPSAEYPIIPSPPSTFSPRSTSLQSPPPSS